MGIKNFTKWVQTYCPTAIELVSFEELKGKRIAIDASLIIYKCVLGIRAMTKKDLTNLEGDLTSHLSGIFYKTLKFLENNMVPIFVFDGKSPDIKALTIKNRLELKEKNPETSFYMKQSHIIHLKELLTAIGIPYINAVGEADPLLAHLNRIGFVDGVCSDDTDILTFGCPTLYKNLIQYMGKPNIKQIQKISLNKIKSHLNWTRNNIIDICLLLGSDYTESIKGLGIVKAQELYLKHNLNINLVLIECQSKNEDIDIDLYYQVKKYFNKNNFTDEYKFRLGPFKGKDVFKIMVEQHNFNDKSIYNAILKYKNAMHLIMHPNN